MALPLLESAKIKRKLNSSIKQKQDDLKDSSIKQKQNDLKDSKTIPVFAMKAWEMLGQPLSEMKCNRCELVTPTAVDIVR